MAERTVLSTFHSRPEAKQAEEKIRSLGIEATEVDELHAHPGTEPTRQAFAITGEIPSLANLTLHTAPDSRNTGILLAADPSASGLSGGEDNITGRNFLLTVVCPENQVEEVVSIVKSCNGFT